MAHLRPSGASNGTKCNQIYHWHVQPVVWRFPSSWQLVKSHHSHLKTTRALVDVWQATETSHRKSRLVKHWQWNIHKLLANGHSYQVMVKSVSGHRVRGSRLLSNLVTSELLTRDHVIPPMYWSTGDCWFTTELPPSGPLSSVVSFYVTIKWVGSSSYWMLPILFVCDWIWENPASTHNY